MLLLTAFLLSYAGFAAFCATTRRHQRQIWKSPPSAGVIFLIRLAAWALVFAAMAPCIMFWGVAMGLVAWVCCLPIAALLLVWPFTYWARPTVMVGGAAGLLAAVLFVSQGLGS